MLSWYHSGQWLETEVALAVDDYGLFQGVIAVERLRTHAHRVFRLDDHLRRLSNSAIGLGIDGLAVASELSDLIRELIDRNADWVRCQPDIGITVLATPGRLRGSQPTVIAYLESLDWKRLERLQRGGERIIITSIVQPPSDMMPRHIKSRSRWHYYRANREARQIDLWASGALLDQDGSITETSSANILVVSKGEIVSPPRDRILPGITLATVREIAHDAGIDWVEKPVTPAMFDHAEEIILTGTGPGVWYGNQKSGPVTAILQQHYHDRTAKA